jgi:hypothetical protein
MKKDYPPLVRTSRKRPCSVCGKHGWCSLSCDGEIAFCMHAAAGSFKTARNGAHLHRLVEASPASNGPKQKPPARIIEAAPAASVEHRDGIYSALLRSHLVLSEQHRAALTARGLDAEAIEQAGYRSTPAAIYAKFVARALSRYDLRGVPGFYKTGGEWSLVDYGAGYYVPVRDHHARIVALQIRRDEADPKFIWCSSAERPEGVSSGSPCHHAKPHLLHDAREVTLTEGALKADVAACFLDRPVIGNAPSCFGADFAENLKASFPQLRTIYVAFDMDFRRNEHVRGALFRLTAQLERARFEVRVRTWPPQWKGIDDYLLSVSEGRAAA